MKLSVLEAMYNLNRDDINDSLINEDLKGFYKNNFKGVFGNIPEKQELARVCNIAKLDPTFKYEEGEDDAAILSKPQGSYFQWLMRQLKQKLVTYVEMMQDAHEYRDQLDIFNSLKKRNRIPADKKDIMAHFKTLRELMDFLMELSTTKVGDEEVEASDFKNELKDIRGFLQKLDCPEIPDSIKTWEDVLQYVGENDKWELWVPKNKQGAYILDQWGKGAGWCVGGSGYKGRDAMRMWDYFTHYNQGGAKYLCFQQKNKNAPRPKNKYLITLGPNGSKPQTSAGYQFNDSNNSRVGNSWGDEGAMEALAIFLEEEGLVDVIKKSEFKDVAALLDVENMERLKNGEPYRYAGGPIRDVFKKSIKTLVYEVDGKEVTVNVEEHPEYLKGETIQDMVNIGRLINGEPYQYNGEEIPPQLKESILSIEFIDTNNYHTCSFDGCSNLKEIELPNTITDISSGAFKGCTSLKTVVLSSGMTKIPSNSFAGLKNLEQVVVPASITVIGMRSFSGCDKVSILTPRHQINCFESDTEFLKQHIKYIKSM